MTPEDIDPAAVAERLAREVMGWHKEWPTPAFEGMSQVWCDDTGFGHMICCYWDPLSNVAQMEMCWRRMRETKGYDTLTQATWICEGERPHLHYYRCLSDREGAPFFGEAKGSKEARVGCEAMIAALDAEKENGDAKV